MSAIELKKENFEEEVLKADKPVVIDFWASWCGPCQMQAPIVDEIAETMGDQYKVCKVNVDDQPALAMEYRVGNIPTLVFVNHGIFQTRLVGWQSKETIVETLESLLDEE